MVGKEKNTGKGQNVERSPSQTEGKSSTTPNHTVSQNIGEKVPYYVMISYYKSADEKNTRAFVGAAEFKKKRLERKFSNAVIDVIKVTKVADFINAWNGVKEKMLCDNSLSLREVHFFGHSNHQYFYFLGESVNVQGLRALDQLVFDKTRPTSAFVIHSCRSSRYEDIKDNADEARDLKCLANALSNHLNIRVVGQVTFATFNTGTKPLEWQYRNGSWANKWEIDWFTMNPNVVLWGYRAGGNVSYADGKTEEYKALSDSQIWPCRAFESGNAELPRAVQAGVFNMLDLYYI